MIKLSLVALLGVTLAAPLAAQTTVDGVIYTSYRVGLVKDTSFVPDGRQNNFEIDRAYINVRSKSAGGISTRVTVDVDSRKAAANQQTFRLKFAYVEWIPEGRATAFRLGMQNTTVIGWEEDQWGYRMQGPMPLDRYKYQQSSDIGISAERSWKAQAVNAHVGFFNGEGYSNAPGDQHKDVAGRVSVRLKATDNETRTGGLRLTGFASIGRANGDAIRNRLLGLVTYQSKVLLIGAEAGSTTDSTAADPETSGSIVSVFGTYQRAGSPWQLMGRVDQWDPNTDLSPGAFDVASSTQTRVIAGASYKLTPNVRILFDADIVSAQGSAVPNAFQAANRNLFLHTEIKF